MDALAIYGVIGFGLLLKNPFTFLLLCGSFIIGSVGLGSFIATAGLTALALSITAPKLDIVPVQFLLVLPIVAVLHVLVRWRT